MEAIVVVWVRGDVVKTDGSSRNGENCMGMKQVYLRENHLFMGIEGKPSLEVCVQDYVLKLVTVRKYRGVSIHESCGI